MSCSENTSNINKTFIVEGNGNDSFIEHTILDSYKGIKSNDMYLIWDDLTIESGSTLANDGRVVIVNGNFNNFGSYSGSGTVELITTNLEYILNYGNQTNGNLIFYTNSPSGWVSGDTVSDISAATGNVLVTKEWVELATSVDNNDFTTGATLIDETIVFNRKDSLSAYTVDISSVNSGDTFVTGFTKSGNTLEIERNDGVNLSLSIDDIAFSGGSGNCITDLYVTNINGCSPINVKDDLIVETKLTLSGTPLLDNTLPQLLVRDSATGEIKYRDVDSVDTFVTGATLVNKELVLDRSDSLSAVTVDLSGLTSNTGAGLTYNETTGKIDLGGVLNHNDPSNAANNVYFIPSTGSNIVRWGADSLGNLPVNSGGSAEYISRFDYVSFQGEHKIFGASGHLGVNIGVYESQTSNNYLKQYKDVAQITIQSTPGVNSSMTFLESDSPNIWNRTIWESHDSNTRSYSKQTFDEFEWNVYNNVGGDNAASKTFFHIESERIVAGAVNSGGTKFGIFQFSPLNIQFLDGDFKGIFTAPSTTYVGDVTKSYLSIVNNLNVSDDSFFNDGTSNKRGIKYKGFGETNTETGVGANYSTLVGTSLVPKKYVDDYIASPSGNTFVTGTTFTNNQLNIALNNGTSVGTTIDNLSGLTVDGNVLVNGDVNIIGTATTINSEQVLIKDNIITLNSNVTGSTTPVLNSGFEVLRGSGDTKSILWLENTDLWSIDDDLSVSGYVSGTTYYGDGSNLTGIDDTFVTGGTYSGSTIVLNRNDGNSVNVTGITSDSIYTADGALTGNRAIDTGNNTLTIDGSNATTSNRKIFVIDKPSGEALSLDEDGDLLINGSIRNSTFFGVEANQNGYWYHGTIRSVIIGKTNTTTRTQFNQNGTLFFNNLNAEIHRIGLAGGGNGEYTTFFKTGFASNRKFIVGGTTSISTEDISLQGDTLISKKLELSTTTDGMLMPRLTTAQMNAISSPDTHLVIFNTDLNALYRYNGSAWVAMAAGYGLVGVVRDSDNGNPTFYSDLQSALDTCKTAGSYNTVTLYSNHTTTTGIVIDGTFDYKYLTINFNGFKLENTQSDATHTLEVLSLVAGATTVLLDGSLIRENGTTGKCIQHNGATRVIQMSKMYLYNENYITLNFGSTGGVFDFGGSIFESGASATIQPLRLTYGNFRNFTVISNSSSDALFMTNGAKATDFIVINKSTGGGITTQTSCIASNFYAETVSGNAVGSGIFSNFVAKSVSGVAVNSPTEAHDFVATTGDNKAVNIGGENISNFRAENNSSTHACVYMSNTEECVQVYAKNKGSGYGIHVFRNQANRSFSYNRITAISEGGIAANLGSNPGFKILFSDCEFVSKWNDVGGHSVQIGGNDTVLTNCSLRVRNAGANNITALSAISAKVANSTFDGATTPINSNVTLSNTFTSDPYGNITI
tara:strand:+ start:8158 stop:12417 length:4260 start_codon:yes stop_codon:yes gene_type:complete